MFTHLFDRTDMNDDLQQDDDYSWCKHGQRYEECDDCAAEIGYVDKCLNCGHYRASSALNAYQCCKRGCLNPNEY